VIFFRSKRTRQIDACLDTILFEIRDWIIPPSVLYVARKLQRRCEKQGIHLSLQEACKIVDRGTHR
jgi:NADH dehydrogenase FAD-containing subunit